MGSTPGARAIRSPGVTEGSLQLTGQCDAAGVVCGRIPPELGDVSPERRVRESPNWQQPEVIEHSCSTAGVDRLCCFELPRGVEDFDVE